jgi:geranylgeranyl reductase family protein
LDRAEFPRDKPCGGGITGRAAQLLPFSIEAVVEGVVDRFEIGLFYARRFVRRSSTPLIFMTRRSVLDAFLVEKAIEAGAIFRDGTKVTEVALRAEDVLVKSGDWVGRSAAVIGADGVNGLTARSLGCDGARLHLVALEADLSHDVVDAARYRNRAVVELGVVPGGYGWVFPKHDHVNIGVVGWEAEGPRLRAHLARLAQEHALDARFLEHVRGYRLPLRGAGDRLASGRGLVAGDAAGLVDPLSGDGIFEAFVSAKLGSQTVLDLIRGRSRGLERYPEALLGALGRLCVDSWGGKLAFDRFPRLSYSITRTQRAWRVISELLQGEPLGPERGGGDRSAPLLLPTLLAKAAGDPGRAYRRELRSVVDRSRSPRGHSARGSRSGPGQRADQYLRRR